MTRTARVERTTRETSVQVAVNLDGSGQATLQTGCGFLDHMLEQLARHGLFDLEVQARGDQHVDDHHTVEDVGITMGQAFRQALGDRRGLCRFGSAFVPLDESLSRVVVDLSNRPTLVWQVSFEGSKLGQFDTALFREWFAAFAGHSGSTLHVENLYGSNDHHKIESCFKAFALALRQACSLDPRQEGVVPSTKGILSEG
ncbi:MAG: imidazoleglycerol-phosphate dehydratase HisB [Magnetococcales bacterium]|nr:imidazoleglycerol-phosphate dehydratase HisB [Magnetococcales bacterium]